MSRPLSREQIRRVDRLAVERYGIPSIVLMENAGRGAAELIDRTYGRRGLAIISCGSGNNGGDGCVIARHLHNAGWSIAVITPGDPSVMSTDMRINFNIVTAMGIRIESVSNFGWVLEGSTADTIQVDALLGTGFRGVVRPPFDSWINAINAASRQAVVAIDVPSGLDCETGLPSNATIRADHTITFVAPKKGFGPPAAKDYIGRLDVVGIGAPRELVDEAEDK